MSKSSTATAPKNPPPLPAKSAWTRGPPQTATAPSPRSQSPVRSTPTHQAHSRRPSTLGQGIPIKDGVSVPSSSTFRMTCDLADAINSNNPAPLPALSTARYISDIFSIQYPEGIIGPRFDLYGGVKEGEFRYDRRFLLQFMTICTEKPPTLPPLDALGLDPAHHQFTPNRRGRRTNPIFSTVSPQPSVSLHPSPGLFSTSTAGCTFRLADFATAGMQYGTRTQPVKQNTSQCESDGREGQAQTSFKMTEVEATKKIKEDLKEFFAVRNLEEAEVYFKIPSQYHHVLVDKLVSHAVESKEADAKLVSDFFDIAASKDLCSAQAFEDGFVPIAEIIDDIAIDAPKAFQLFALMVKGAKLDEDRRNRLASKSMDSNKLLSLFRGEISTVSYFTTDVQMYGAHSNISQAPLNALPIAHGGPRAPIKGNDVPRLDEDKMRSSVSVPGKVSAHTSKKATQTNLRESNVVADSRPKPMGSHSTDAAAAGPIVDTKSVLVHGTPEDLETDTTRKIKDDLKEFFAIRIAEIIDDIAIDAPKAFQLLALMVKGTRLDRRATLAAKSMDSDQLLALLQCLQ